MNTHQYAVELRKAADFLLSRPGFEVEMDIYTSLDPVRFGISFYSKDKFVEAAKALGNATKEYTEGEYAKLKLSSTEFPIQLDISRNKVCTKKIVFECEPLFSTDEVEAL